MKFIYVKNKVDLSWKDVIALALIMSEDTGYCQLQNVLNSATHKYEVITSKGGQSCNSHVEFTILSEEKRIIGNNPINVGLTYIGYDDDHQLKLFIRDIFNKLNKISLPLKDEQYLTNIKQYVELLVRTIKSYNMGTSYKLIDSAYNEIKLLSIRMNKIRT